MTSAPVRPPGWVYNPSDWSQRLPLVLWSLVGFAIAGYLSLYQWRVFPSVWEPFFGGGSTKVLNSAVSRLLPFPDAALGAAGYLFDALTGIIGGRRRWKSMPWMVLLFGIAAGPMGLVGLLLVITQPVWVGGWCTLCLASAAISVGMISPSLDEVLASLQHLKREKAAGRSHWKTFWNLRDREGAAPPDGEMAGPAPQDGSALQLVVALLGLWLTAAPAALSYYGRGRVSDWVLGPVIASFAVMASWEFMRPVRWVNVVLGLAVAAAALFLQVETVARANGMLCGLSIAALSLSWDVYRPSLFAGGWRSLRK